MALDMIYTGGPYGDCCYSYDVKLVQEYTVKEFVEEILKEKPNEWGKIRIVTDINKIFSSKRDECSYHYGKIDYWFSNSRILNANIDKAKARGGWTSMDYFIKIKDQELFYEKTEDKHYSKNRQVRIFQKRNIIEFENFLKKKFKSEYNSRFMNDTLILFPNKKMDKILNYLKRLLIKR